MAKSLRDDLERRGLPPDNISIEGSLRFAERAPLPDNDKALALDLIWEVKGIAREIGRTERQALHLLETRKLPATKIGGRWVASRATLRQWFGDRLSEASVRANAAGVHAVAKTRASDETGLDALPRFSGRKSGRR
jgi:hypothetical protein